MYFNQKTARNQILGAIVMGIGAGLFEETVYVNEYDARGIGEIGLTGCTSAIASTTYYATGIRVRELPIRIEKLMKA